MSEQLTTREKIMRFVVEWTNAAGAPVSHVRAMIDPLLDAYAADVAANAVCTRVHVWDDVPVNPDGSGIPWEGTPSDPAMIVQLNRGHRCGEETWFDRTVCPEPCGSMHSYCTVCGTMEGKCPHSSEASPQPVDAKVFGRIVRRIRKRRGMTRAHLAEQLYPGYASKGDIKRVERGEIACTPEECRMIASILGVELTVDGTPLDTM